MRITARRWPAHGGHVVESVNHPDIQVYSFFAWAALMLKFWKNLTGPCGAPTYLPTYLPYLWETKKEIMGGVKVGYYTN